MTGSADEVRVLRVSLKSSDGQSFTWKKLRERYSQACMISQLAFFSCLILFWGGISLEAHTDFAVI